MKSTTDPALTALQWNTSSNSSGARNGAAFRAVQWNTEPVSAERKLWMRVSRSSINGELARIRCTIAAISSTAAGAPIPATSAQFVVATRRAGRR